jgi:hypothetical protein
MGRYYTDRELKQIKQAIQQYDKEHETENALCYMLAGTVILIEVLFAACLIAKVYSM